jgi:hypothetical protein
MQCQAVLRRVTYNYRLVIVSRTPVHSVQQPATPCKQPTARLDENSTETKSQLFVENVSGS